MAEYMNVERPAVIPIRPGGDPAPVIARLVRLDGTQVRVPGRSVRYAGGTHVAVAVGVPVEYFWLRIDDVDPGMNNAEPRDTPHACRVRYRHALR